MSCYEHQSTQTYKAKVDKLYAKSEDEPIQIMINGAHQSTLDGCYGPEWESMCSVSVRHVNWLGPVQISNDLVNKKLRLTFLRHFLSRSVPVLAQVEPTEERIFAAGQKTWRDWRLPWWRRDRTFPTDRRRRTWSWWPRRLRPSWRRPGTWGPTQRWTAQRSGWTSDWWAPTGRRRRRWLRVARQGRGCEQGWPRQTGAFKNVEGLGSNAQEEKRLPWRPIFFYLPV